MMTPVKAEEGGSVSVMMNKSSATSYPCDERALNQQTDDGSLCSRAETTVAIAAAGSSV